MKTIIGAIGGVVIVLAIIVGVSIYYNNQSSDKKDSKDSGYLIIGFTDAAADIQDVSDINLTVDKVELYSETKGWVNVSSSDKTYKLLTLRDSGKIELYAKSRMSAGNYDRVRVTLADATVKTKSKGNVKAYMPSKEIVMNSRISVKGNSDSSLKLDVLADQSIHKTNDDKYVFAPVVKSEARSGSEVKVDQNDSVTVSGGSIDSAITVGVDLDGSSKENFVLNTSADLNVESSVLGGVKFILAGKTYSETDSGTDSNSTTNTSSSTTDVRSIQTEARGVLNVGL